MLHELFTLTRPLVVLDCETTGLDMQADRIIELGLQRWTPEGLTAEWRTLINPGMAISVESTAIHHIGDADVQGCQVCGCVPIIYSNVPVCGCGGGQFTPWPRFKNIAARLAYILSDCDFAGKNVRFDLRIIEAEMKRAGQPWTYSGARIIDIDRLEQLAIPRRLSDLYEKYTGEKLEDAHSALVDVQASSVIIGHQMTQHAQLPRDLDALHQLQWPGWLTADGSFRIMNGKATCVFGKHRGKTVADIPRDYWDWILRSDFADDVKALAREVKLGRIPDGKSEDVLPPS